MMKKIIFSLLFIVSQLSFSFAQSEVQFALGADSLMKEAGMNAVRLEISDATSPMDEALSAKAQGLEILADLCDAKKVADVLKTLKKTGITPKWIEISGQSADYKNVKSVFPEAIVVVSLDNGYDNNICNSTLDNLKENGGKWDMIGLTLYPYKAVESGMESNAKQVVAKCIRNIRKLSEKYACDVMISETGFDVDETQPWKQQLDRELYADLLKRTRTETANHCKGVFYAGKKSKEIMRALVNDNLDSQLSGYDRRIVEISTTEGNIYVELYNETPKHRDNFLKLATNHTLDTCSFFRNIPNFMIQGGSPALEAQDKTIPAEIIYPKAFHKRGALAMAREGDEENPTFRSGQFEFYIVWGSWPASQGSRPYVDFLPYYNEYGEAGTPWLDGGYTVFGEVVKGLEVVDKIQNQKNIKILGLKVLN